MDLVEKFDAKGKSGAGYHVEVYQQEVENPPCVRSYRLHDGRMLEPITEGKFKIVQTGEKIYRI